jgi:hypothetical protein
MLAAKKHSRRNDQWLILAAPLTSCVIAGALCAVAAFQIAHLWERHDQQRTQMERLEASVHFARSHRDAQQEILEKNFDPKQLQPLLREKYGLISAQDRLIQFKTTVQK